MNDAMMTHVKQKVEKIRVYEVVWLFTVFSPRLTQRIQPKLGLLFHMVDHTQHVSDYFVSPK